MVEKDPKENEEENENIYYRINKIAFPAVVIQFSTMLPNTINIWAAGKMNDPVLLDAVGLGMSV